MSQKVLLSQTPRTPVPQKFKEIHSDLWVLYDPNIRSGTLKSAYLIMVVPLAIMGVVYGFEQNWKSALSYGAVVLVMLLVGLAAHYATRVNREECRYASWILKEMNPTEMEAQFFTVEEGVEGERLYRYVFTFGEHPELQFEPYVLTKNGSKLQKYSERAIAARSLKLNVYCDPADKQPVVAEDLEGTRYWLNTRTRFRPES